MSIDKPAVRDRLSRFDLTGLFTQELGWDFPAASVTVTVSGHHYRLLSVAQKRGVQILQCPPGADGGVPDYATRRKIDKQLAKSAHEHLIIFVDQVKATQIWQWVARSPGQPAQCREHHYHPQHQSGDALIQKLSQIYIPLDEDEALDLTGTTHRLRDAFDRDRVTKKFYDRFKTEHAAFLGFIKGITDQADKEWYASLMLNRLMFIYFIQRKGFLDGNVSYLRDRLHKVQIKRGKGSFLTFYRYFLLKLFHEGLDKEPGERVLDAELTELLGTVPYLNGGLFDVHEIEERNPKLDIPDEAFERLFAFFDDWDWVLDTRPISSGKEINPEVLGYIFEKYINQKELGAYYTKEDITEYISKSTIIPHLFDAAKKEHPAAFEPGSALWQLLRDDPDRYIYPSVRHGVLDPGGNVLPLSAAIAEGIADVSKRGAWNRPAPDPYALPSETWREHVARRQRCLEIRENLRRGDVHQINDLITLNLNIRQFAEDVISGSEGPDLLRAFWHAVRDVTVLDPTCGSGAFLFAALGVLQPLYEACLVRMQAFVDDLERSGKPHSPKKYEDFRAVLADVERHPNRDYFILKSLIVKNLYGVDIVEEAVEICKLRLFLKLVAHVEPEDPTEPLPDIDFNIRTGNTLVGFASLEDVKRTILGTLVDSELKAQVNRIIEDAEVVSRAFEQFHLQQTRYEQSAGALASSKRGLREQLKALTEKLDRFLAGGFGVDPGLPEQFSNWHKNHRPFHWFAEFYGIVASGGFDVVLGNPPYVEIPRTLDRKILRQSFKTALESWSRDEDLYTLVVERSFQILGNSRGRFGMILPLSIAFSTKRPFQELRRFVSSIRGDWWFSHFDRIPSALFGNEVRTRSTIAVYGPSSGTPARRATTGLARWATERREALFPTICYSSFASTVSFIAGIPKVGSRTQADALGTLLLKGSLLESDLVQTVSFSSLVRVFTVERP